MASLLIITLVMFSSIFMSTNGANILDKATETYECTKLVGEHCDYLSTTKDSSTDALCCAHALYKICAEGVHKLRCSSEATSLQSILTNIPKGCEDYSAFSLQCINKINYPTWAIVVAAIVGVIFLIFVICCCRCCFCRSRK